MGLFLQHLQSRVAVQKHYMLFSIYILYKFNSKLIGSFSRDCSTYTKALWSGS